MISSLVAAEQGGTAEAINRTTAQQKARKQLSILNKRINPTSVPQIFPTTQEREERVYLVVVKTQFVRTPDRTCALLNYLSALIKRGLAAESETGLTI
jgi:hypothetical protein